MSIASQLSGYLMNEEQKEVVSHKEGPLLVIAGPGSGKTRSLTLLAMNLLLCGDARPEELVFCTYTEKAAYEMQDLITSIAKNVGYTGDLSQLRIGTIHSICNQFITEHLHHTPLGNNYEMLDEFSQRLFIFEHLEQICVHGVKTIFQERWGTQWQITKKLQFLFDKIADELIFDALKEKYPRLTRYPAEKDTFVCCLTHAYQQYQKLLAGTNSIDFAHLQKCAYNLLRNQETFHRITKDIRYVLVDEYQDTNYIQEQILMLLASATPTRNLCVVGDEDQALYRFRGATVRNILEFANKFPECKQVRLTTNYRSHLGIIDVYNRWMTSIDWSNATGTAFRTNKIVRPVMERKYVKYASVVSILNVDVHTEAEQLAEIIYALKEQERIHDYSEVALLLHSVRTDISNPYVEALARKGIAAFCPRARAYFDQEEVRLIVACFAQIVGYQEVRYADIVEQDALPDYLRDCAKQLMQQRRLYPALERALRTIEGEILHAGEEPHRTPKQLADYFYHLIFTEPFITFLADERKLHNLVRFSEQLRTFQNYYHHTGVTRDSLQQIEFDLFHRFFCLLYEDGVNLYENEREPFPLGHVQIMTIHQAKGLEFPVVVVGRLDKLPPRPNNADKELQAFYHQSPFEPVQRMPAFDVRRLYYVAFSRAKGLLILTANKSPNQQFAAIIQRIPEYSRIDHHVKDIPPLSKSGENSSPQPKPRYSFTNHIQMYETCPRQFQFFREYNFVSARSVDAFSGLLVHQTLELLHRHVLDGKADKLNDEQVHKIFERSFTFLQYRSTRQFDASEKENAWRQVMNYFHQNRQELDRIQAAEFNVQVEKDDYVLTGKIDLLMKGKGGLDILDFKTSKRPTKNSDALTAYKQQLYLYAHALEKRTGNLPKRLLLYWTAEDSREDALMEIPYHREDVNQVSTYFDTVVASIRQREFDVVRLPDPKTCQVCDIRHLCRRQGMI